ncbi:MAG: cytidylyltransferase domain-containing protein [Sulfurihydrogenibium sp.]|jgi:CMP-N-acetylneuraminic acid synthetase|uniref:acylneuraminate cytidylyltransferase family protein n=1 Tax=Sulfurihydrogenibium sp. TaxID=2053621 RepID=UPI003D0A2AC8
MYQGKTILAIIPARGKSKRLPNKNILPLAGKPLISWTIESALKSKYIDKIVVSSDSEKILQIAKDYGIETVRRPKELATDTASSVDVVKHVLENVAYHDYVILLQPTSPLRTEKHIDEAIEYLYQKKADAVISVCEVEHSPLLCNTLPEDLSMKDFIPENVKGKRSQDLPKFYRINGAIYLCKTHKFLEENTFFIKENIYAYIMEQKDSVDIDTYLDFKLAEVIIKDNVSQNI